MDRLNHHLFQPLLYQVATGILSEGEIAPPLRGVLHRHRNIEVELAEVNAFDLEARKVTAMGPDGRVLELPYDSLIVAGGAGQSYFGHDEFSRWAPGMKTINDALELRGRILGAFEMAELEQDPEKQKEWLTFVVVGGGPTGVEIAGQIAELSRRVLKDDFRRVDPRNARVIICDGGKQVLAMFGDRLSGKAAEGLGHLGVELQMSSIVTDVDQTGVVVKQGDEERRIACRTKVWAAGVEASPLARMLGDATGADVDRAGRVAVLPDCTLPGHPEVFAIGDMMSLDELPGVAEVAMQQGIHASTTIKRRLDGQGGEAVPLPRPGEHGDHLPLPGGGELQGNPAVGLHRLARLALRPPGLPHRFQEPSGHHSEMGDHLHRQQPPPAHDHDAAGHRARRNRAGRRPAIPDVAGRG